MNLSEMQSTQPWTVPYSSRMRDASHAGRLPYLYATHTVLHASKTVGKLAGIFEALDHRESVDLKPSEMETIQDMAADLVTAALRIANLYSFSLEHVLRDRVKEKNGVGFGEDET